MIKDRSGDLLFLMTDNEHVEQYQVLDHLGRKAGYVQILKGELSCSYPSAGGTVIYKQKIATTTNRFDDEAQRIACMTAIAEAIQNKKRDIRATNKRKYARMHA
jgi:hypothetical protein